MVFWIGGFHFYCSFGFFLFFLLFQLCDQNVSIVLFWERSKMGNAKSYLHWTCYLFLQIFIFVDLEYWWEWVMFYISNLIIDYTNFYCYIHHFFIVSMRTFTILFITSACVIWIVLSYNTLFVFFSPLIYFFFSLSQSYPRLIRGQ